MTIAEQPAEPIIAKDRQIRELREDTHDKAIRNYF